MIANLQPYPEYKESGLPWLGKLPAHWDIRRAKWRFASRWTQIERDRAPTDRHLSSSYRWQLTLRKTADCNGSSRTRFDESSYKRVRAGDLVIQSTRCLGRMQWACRTCDGNRAVRFILSALPSPRVIAHLPRFLVSQMSRHSRILATSSMASGSARQLSATDALRQDYRVLLPPPEEQAAMVRFLDYANGRLERAIRAKRKVIALLHEQKQAIIHRAVTRGLDPTVPLKPSGIPWLGDIPKHWEVPRSRSTFSVKWTSVRRSG